MFYEDLLKLYIENIESNSNLAKIGSPITFYLADKLNSTVSYTGNNKNKILEIDITSAFPTICNNLYKDNIEFLNKLNTITDKKQKNIFIATTLDNKQLKILNQICKLIITGLVFDQENNNDIDILELKKDGCIIITDNDTYSRLLNLNTYKTKFNNFLIENNFNFHINEYSKYIRSNRTTILLSDDLSNLSIKGVYKHTPIQVPEIMKNILLKNDQKIPDLNRIYSHKFFKIIQKNNLKTYLQNYYLCDKNKVISNDGKYVRFQYDTQIDPNIYKKLFFRSLEF
jgi:hypothetical protein